jgi:mannose-6-phosphate isomerase
MTNALTHHLLLLEPEYRTRVWGGHTLKHSDPPIGEVWIVWDNNPVRTGVYAGQTLAALATEHGAELLGTDVAAHYGTRFPLLIKLLDCADWLSVQVHPNDEQAEQLVGPGNFGKTEAWHFLNVDPGARILAGVKPGTTAEALEAAIRSGQVVDVAQSFPVQAGNTTLIAAGTLHALGPGMVLYEVQQSSDTTYRVYDWDRPASAGRTLHIEESVAVTVSRKVAQLVDPPVLHGTQAVTVVACPYFTLDVLQVATTPLHGDTAQQSFHVLTTAAGTVEVACAGERVLLGTHDTLIVAGGAGTYTIEAHAGTATVLRAAVPPRGADVSVSR